MSRVAGRRASRLVRARIAASRPRSRRRTGRPGQRGEEPGRLAPGATWASANTATGPIANQELPTSRSRRTGGRSPASTSGRPSEHHRGRDRDRNDRHRHREQQRDERQLGRDGEAERRVEANARRQHHHHQSTAPTGAPRTHGAGRPTTERRPPPRKTRPNSDLGQPLARGVRPPSARRNVSASSSCSSRLGSRDITAAHRPNAAAGVSAVDALPVSNIRPDIRRRACRPARRQPKQGGKPTTEKGKPGASRGRKARDLTQGEIARLPVPTKEGAYRWSSSFSAAARAHWAPAASSPCSSAASGGRARARRHLQRSTPRRARHRRSPKPLLSFGDSNWYTLTPGESLDNFDGGGWTLTGGAQIQTTDLADGQTGSVLDLPSGSTAVSPTICVDSRTIRPRAPRCATSSAQRESISPSPTRAPRRRTLRRTPARSMDTRPTGRSQTPFNVQPSNTTRLAARALHARPGRQDQRLPDLQLLAGSANEPVAPAQEPDSWRCSSLTNSAQGRASPGR